jgi:hypothetical protein
MPNSAKPRSTSTVVMRSLEVGALAMAVRKGLSRWARRARYHQAQRGQPGDATGGEKRGLSGA